MLIKQQSGDGQTLAVHFQRSTLASKGSYLEGTRGSQKKTMGEGKRTRADPLITFTFKRITGCPEP